MIKTATQMGLRRMKVMAIIMAMKLPSWLDREFERADGDIITDSASMNNLMMSMGMRMMRMKSMAESLVLKLFSKGGGIPK